MAALSVIVVLILSELARGRFQRVIDRRFFREKYKFDQAMQKMRLAVGSLVDRATLGRRLLEAAAEVLRLEWGAIYLRDAPDGPLPPGGLPRARRPTSRRSPTDNPLVARLQADADGPALARHGARAAASDPATDAMIALGGEAATAAGGRRRAGRAAGPGAQAERHALRGRGDGVPGRPRLGGHAGLALGRTSSRPSRASTRSCATRSTRSPSSSGGS